jgi:hypothetical protein
MLRILATFNWLLVIEGEWNKTYLGDLMISKRALLEDVQGYSDMRTFPADCCPTCGRTSISIDAWNFSLLHLPAGVEKFDQINST